MPPKARSPIDLNRTTALALFDDVLAAGLPVTASARPISHGREALWSVSLNTSTYDTVRLDELSRVCARHNCVVVLLGGHVSLVPDGSCA